MRMKSLKVQIIVLIAAILGVALFTGGKALSHRTDSYALVGDGYWVAVSQKQFEQFGQGDFADLDLEGFVEQFNLEKIYDDNIEVTPPPSTVVTENNTDGTAVSRPA